MFAASAEAWSHVRPSCKPGQGSEQPVLGHVGRTVVKAFFCVGLSLHVCSTCSELFEWRFGDFVIFENLALIHRGYSDLVWDKGSKDKRQEHSCLKHNLWADGCSRDGCTHCLFSVLLVGRQKVLWLPLIPRILWCSGLNTLLYKIG